MYIVHPEPSTDVCVDSSQNIYGDLDVYAKDLESIEKVVILQVEELANKMPEIYNGYAKVIREVSMAVNEILRTTSYNRYSGKVAMAAEFLARTSKAFGNYKAAKQHNRLLDKLLLTKKMYAESNLLKVRDASSQAQRKLKQIERLFSVTTKQQYRLSQLDGDKAERVSFLVLRVLTLYRQSLFISDLSEYLVKEYEAWLSGKQTSRRQRPDYYSVNKKISRSLYGEDVYNALRKAADESNSLSGAQVILLSDSQLSVLALSNNLCEFNLDEAMPPIRKMLEINKGIEQYNTYTEALRKHVDQGVGFPIWMSLALMAVIVALARWICLDLTSWGEDAFWGISVASVCVIIRCVIKSRRKKAREYAEEGIKIAAETDEKLSAHCGAIRSEDIDYEKKNALSMAVSSFLN